MILLDEPEKPAPKSSFRWASLIIFIYFMVRGFMEYSKGNATYATILLTVGVGGLIFKVYSMAKE